MAQTSGSLYPRAHGLEELTVADSLRIFDAALASRIKRLHATLTITTPEQRLVRVIMQRGDDFLSVLNNTGEQVLCIDNATAYFTELNHNEDPYSQSALYTDERSAKLAPLFDTPAQQFEGERRFIMPMPGFLPGFFRALNYDGTQLHYTADRGWNFRQFHRTLKDYLKARGSQQ